MKLECEEKNKRYYEIPKTQRPVTNKNKIYTQQQAISNAMRDKGRHSSTVVLFSRSKESYDSVCFGMAHTVRAKITMKSKNDVAASVLAHAKARISKFIRYASMCLSNRFCGAEMSLIMTDTDSASHQLRFPVVLRRNKKTKKLVFENEQVREEMMQRMLGADNFKRHVKLFLSAAPEMSRIVDSAHFEKTTSYYDGSRKKQVGLYTDEVPLPKMIMFFQTCGPKNYHFRQTSVGRENFVNKVKHKGISNRTFVSADEYTDTLMLWDKQYDLNRSVMGYRPHQNREDLFKNVQVIDHTNITTTDKKGRRTTKLKSAKRTVLNLEENKQNVFTSRSFYTTQAGVFLTRADKRLCVGTSDKVMYPRHDFGAYSIGSRFVNRVRHFNNAKSYNALFTDKHLQELRKMENDFLENEMHRYYPNGVRSDLLIRHAEKLDHQVNIEYLFRRWDACEKKYQKVEMKMNDSIAKHNRLNDEHEERVIREDVKLEAEIKELLKEEEPTPPPPPKVIIKHVTLTEEEREFDECIRNLCM